MNNVADTNDQPPPEGLLAYWIDPLVGRKLRPRQCGEDRTQHSELKDYYDRIEDAESKVAQYWDEIRLEILEILKQRGQKK